MFHTQSEINLILIFNANHKRKKKNIYIKSKYYGIIWDLH